MVAFLFEAGLVFFEEAVLRHEVLLDQVFIVFGAPFGYGGGLVKFGG